MQISLMVIAATAVVWFKIPNAAALSAVEKAAKMRLALDCLVSLTTSLTKTKEGHVDYTIKFQVVAPISGAVAMVKTVGAKPEEKQLKLADVNGVVCKFASGEGVENCAQQKFTSIDSTHLNKPLWHSELLSLYQAIQCDLS